MQYDTRSQRSFRTIKDYCPKCGKDTKHQIIENNLSGETLIECLTCNNEGLL